MGVGEEESWLTLVARAWGGRRVWDARGWDGDVLLFWGQLPRQPRDVARAARGAGAAAPLESGGLPRQVPGRGGATVRPARALLERTEQEPPARPGRRSLRRRARSGGESRPAGGGARAGRRTPRPPDAAGGLSPGRRSRAHLPGPRPPPPFPARGPLPFLHPRRPRTLARRGPGGWPGRHERSPPRTGAPARPAAAATAEGE
ncbi:small membrane A-kinase anchor protein isoform X1 [Sarcophilus harrisii]|uniref:small membrane A-kinase anchor protein isoform X1 n=1 Tax=Sarcophilus harrisii TaxID=9305 RepID=UPI001301D64D|nr:small membrane A-kinase anchor protein isoform X1 [Sarcophilus harrisii]